MKPEDQRGADVNHQDIKGNTPLIKAVGRNNKEIVQILPRGGADANLKDVKGKTALKYVSPTRNPELYKILKDAEDSK